VYRVYEGGNNFFLPVLVFFEFIVALAHAAFLYVFHTLSLCNRSANPWQDTINIIILDGYQIGKQRNHVTECSESDSVRGAQLNFSLLVKALDKCTNSDIAVVFRATCVLK